MPAHALDGTETPASEPPALPSVSYKDAKTAEKAGIDSLQKGDMESSVPALKYAASQGRPYSQWKLGSMYQRGDEGVARDDAQAYHYFQTIVDNYIKEADSDDSDDASQLDRSIVSKAFVGVGYYSLNGIPGKLKPNVDLAFDMFQYAATNFGDPDAQYNLARMYLDGAGVEKNVPQAVKWLNLAAEKNHIQAQAVLGNLLFNGGGGVPRQRGRGLMWLSLANDKADCARDKWICDDYNQINNSAQDVDRQMAKTFAIAHAKGGD
ncbi:sel1 repeat family protein [Methylovirgula sp. 4M-Z18]|nr:sel1 repeat family protein [Methylovirgula sp. 4M-Z18]